MEAEVLPAGAAEGLPAEVREETQVTVLPEAASETQEAAGAEDSKAAVPAEAEAAEEDNFPGFCPGSGGGRFGFFQDSKRSRPLCDL